jgi:hypothetical protein
MTELKGHWSVTSMPVKLSATPAYIGGTIDRAAPCYGEDNETILGELLGYSRSSEPYCLRPGDSGASLVRAAPPNHTRIGRGHPELSVQAHTLTKRIAVS